ncbi:MAG: DNA adenine methylase [Nostocaceae cyanobacterium]|nr:DNA adenine methylase [Nostocaceae cyanobacterium]
MITSPLRYPGGKQKAINQIINYLPTTFSEYREPFVGGGSLFIYLKQKYPKLKFWINDLNPELFLFWKYSKLYLDDLLTEIRKIKNHHNDGRQLFEIFTFTETSKLSELERAVRFFVLNRITFSGTIESGGYSEQSFHKRFTESSIERLANLNNIFSNVQITNLDYSEVIHQSGDDVFIFLDPPYFKATKSRLYGKRGELHTSFDHERFAAEMKRCPHQWLITYDDSIEIRKNFDFAYIYSWEMQYGMNNYKQALAQKGKELFISNYEVKQENNPHQLTLNLVTG